MNVTASTSLFAREAAADEMGDAERDDARLARARAGEDEQRPFDLLDGFALLGVESVRKSIRLERRVARGHAPLQYSERRTADAARCRVDSYSTVTLLARLRGWSTSQPRRTAMW